MILYVLRRLAATTAILLVICAATFAIFYLMPADPAQGACGKACSPERIAQIRTTLGLNHSVFVQFRDYLVGIVAGRSYGTGARAVHCPAPCLGFSFQTDQPVWRMLTDRLPVSVSIAMGAAALWLIVGVTAGAISALRRGSLWDRAAMTAALGGVSLPVYFTALVLQYLLVVKLGLLPYPQAIALTADPVGWAQSMVMPWITLAMLYAGIYARMTRGEMLDSLGQNYVRTARAKGLPESAVLRRHALRPALMPIVTIFGMDLGALLGGALITESVFGLPGVGKLAADAINSADQPVILGVTLFAAAFVVLANVAVDLVYALLDPRVRAVG
ncbi:peptide/nickel transport system permease protein [Streptomyces griseochromogenes]|uniref:ABC transporter permease n=1 Tax=Streptomyces griseochromogenes TaxID=68214 RepID=A0A1B1AYQ6_9ACTN|nr:ABC transporter permease [Streptomyces griseochromogenes]ANP51713.1 ABC transporter permease [Streptomyces griseochromogenes]MBP2056732.1 peptide/nickel transport system permease protein [Streptomyces griseochromogenes]